MIFELRCETKNIQLREHVQDGQIMIDYQTSNISRCKQVNLCAHETLRRLKRLYGLIEN